MSHLWAETTATNTFFLLQSPPTFPDGQVVAIPWESPYVLKLMIHISE